MEVKGSASCYLLSFARLNCVFASFNSKNNGPVLLLQATRGAYNPNLQVFITPALDVCSQHPFGLPLRMYGMHRTLWSWASRPSTPCNLIMRVLTICHVKLMQSTAMEQKRFDLWSLSSPLPNLWLYYYFNTILSRWKFSCYLLLPMAKMDMDWNTSFFKL